MRKTVEEPDLGYEEHERTKEGSYNYYRRRRLIKEGKLKKYPCRSCGLRLCICQTLLHETKEPQKTEEKNST